MAEEVEEDHVLNVEKKATCLENVQKKEQTAEVEEVEADLKPALNVVRKDTGHSTVPTVAAEVAVRVRVDEPVALLNVVELLLQVAVTPLGSPETLSVTAPL